MLPHLISPVKATVVRLALSTLLVVLAISGVQAQQRAPTAQAARPVPRELTPTPQQQNQQASRDRDINVEATYTRQPTLVDAALAKIEPSPAGTSQLYFVGFASFADQDVFIREVTSVREIMDTRFGTAGRSLVLINHRDTFKDQPLASVSNLERALAGIAKQMDHEKDLLVLYITTHGAPGRVSVEFPRLQLNDLGARRLARLLDESGIKRRVVIISACYAGSFISQLKSDHTAVLAAARADRTSFGCSNERSWTYFGEALFNRALRESYSFTAAFDRARGIVAEMEKAQKMSPPSEPQIDIGPGIAPWLDVTAKRLERAASTPTIPAPERAAPTAGKRAASDAAGEEPPLR